MCQQNMGDFFDLNTYTVRKAQDKEVVFVHENRENETLDLDDWIFSGEEYQTSDR